MSNWLKLLYRHLFVGMGASSIGFITLFASLHWRVTVLDQGFALGSGALVGLLTLLFHTTFPRWITWTVISLAGMLLLHHLVASYHLPIFNSWQEVVVNLIAIAIIWLMLFLINRWAFDKEVYEVNRLLTQRKQQTKER